MRTEVTKTPTSETFYDALGNAVANRDVADNWLHEGFTSYAETLFAEWIKGKDSAFAYTTGKWANIKNDRPVIGDYGVQDDGSGDKYEKGAAVVHMIRLMLRADTTFRRLLRGLNRDFYHKIVTSAEVENYINDYIGLDLKPFFDQYLRTTNIPTLQWKMDKKNNLRLHWANATPDFCAPVIISQDGKDMRIIYPNVQNGSDYLIKEFNRKNLSIKAAGLYKIEKK